MRKIWNKGHRIRASDKHLVYHFSIGTLLFLFVAVLLLLNMKQLMRTDWGHFCLLEKFHINRIYKTVCLCIYTPTGCFCFIKKFFQFFSVLT